MALVVKDRVQELTTTSGTGTLTLSGAVPGYQTFSSSIGNSNTTFYTIYDSTAQTWEVGIGTVGAGTLARNTVLSNSLGTTALVSFAGNSSFVFCTYPAEQSVNLDASNNVSPLGTIASGTWQGTTIGVAYGGTGVTTSSGANSVMLRDSNQNVAVNRLNQSNTNTTAAGGVTALTTASSYIHTLSGTGSQTYTMPDATTLATGVAFLFNNMATGTLTLQDYATGPIGTIPSGGAAAVFLTVNATVGGTWDLHAYLPEGVTFGTNAFNLGTSVITGGTWNGGTIGTAYGGTGLTTFSAANYALYSTSASALVAGTLPVAAGGTGTTSTTFTNLTTNVTGTLPVANGGTGITSLGTGVATFLGTPSSANLATAVTDETGSGSLVFATSPTIASPTFTSQATFAAGTAALPAITTTGDTNTGIFFPAADTIAFAEGGAEAMRIDSSGNVGIGNTPSGTFKLDVTGSIGASASITVGSSGVYSAGSIYSDASWGMIFRAKQASPTQADFRWANSADTERMRIDSSGNVGIGNTSPDALLTVNTIASFGDGAVGTPSIAHKGDLNTGLWFPAADTIAASTAGSERMRISSAGGFSVGTTSDPGAGAIYATGNITAFFSDIRLKNNEGRIDNALDKVSKLSGIYYTTNETAKEYGYTDEARQVGVIAQEVKEVLPEIVKAAPFDLDENGKSKSGEDYMTVQYDKLVPLLIEAIKELSEKVAKLEAK